MHRAPPVRSTVGRRSITRPSFSARGHCSVDYYAPSPACSSPSHSYRHHLIIIIAGPLYPPSTAPSTPPRRRPPLPLLIPRRLPMIVPPPPPRQIAAPDGPAGNHHHRKDIIISRAPDVGSTACLRVHQPFLVTTGAGSLRPVMMRRSAYSIR